MIVDKLTLKDVDLKDKRVIMRVDFNVPLDSDLNITDDIRIQAALTSILYILEQSPSQLILMSHFGRPQGRVVDSMSLAPIARHLGQLIGEEILMCTDCIGDEVTSTIEEFNGRVVLLENLRFHKEETENNLEFAKKLADFADVYVNDAFGAIHRAHASTTGITEYLPSVAGFLVEKEILYFSNAINNPKTPFVVILGGAKVSDKILLIESLLDKVDALIIGGGMAYTFLKAQGQEIGGSLCEDDRLEKAKELLVKAKEKNVDIHLTEDFLVVEDFGKPEGREYVDNIEPHTESVDIGLKTIAKFKDVLSNAKTIVWNGPLGVFEQEAYAEGTKQIAEYLATLEDAITIVGGGDSAAAVKKFNVASYMTHISTGGGASLEYLEGKDLLGIMALDDKSKDKMNMTK